MTPIYVLWHKDWGYLLSESEEHADAQWTYAVMEAKRFLKFEDAVVVLDSHMPSVVKDMKILNLNQTVRPTMKPKTYKRMAV